MAFSSLLVIVSYFCLFVPIYSDSSTTPPPRPHRFVDPRKFKELTTDRCFEPLLGGKGNKIIELYYYNREEKACKPFIYRGNGGNYNQFYDLEHCEKICKGSCTMKKDSGDDKASFVRYYYNAEKAKCLEFSYGGSGGNDNRFKTMNSCIETCILERYL